MDELERLKQLISDLQPTPYGQVGEGERVGGPLMSDRVPAPRETVKESFDEDDEFLGSEGRERWIALAKKRGFSIEKKGDPLYAFDGEYDVGSHNDDDSHPTSDLWGYLEEANPNGSHSEGEHEEREHLLGMFEMEFDELLSTAIEHAEEIGSQFRSPGIKKQIKDILIHKMRSF